MCYIAQKTPLILMQSTFVAGVFRPTRDIPCNMINPAPTIGTKVIFSPSYNRGAALPFNPAATPLESSSYAETQAVL